MVDEPPKLTLLRNEYPEVNAYVRALEDAAYLDPLTGLLRPEPFRQALIETVYRGSRDGESSSLIRLDLDGFKKYNDTYGHEAGDQLLARFSHALRKSIRTTDVAGRLGGDEFAVIYNGVDEEHVACQLTRRLYNGIENGDLDDVGVSVGLYKILPMAQFLHRNGWDDNAIVSYILDKADKAVYASKAVKNGHPLTISVYGSQELPILIGLAEQGSLRRAA